MTPPPAFCMSRKRTVTRLKALQNRLAARLEERLPRPVASKLGNSLLAAQRRLSDLLAMINLCIEANGEAAVLRWGQ